MLDTDSVISENICSGGFGQPQPRQHDYQAVASLLKSCAAFLAINSGKSLHSRVLKIGHFSCHYVSKALLNMYAKCGALHDCKKLFGEVGRSDHDPVFWNILLSGFAGSQSRMHDAETLRLFSAMHIANEPKPSSVTAAIILPVCSRAGDINAGRSIHCYAIKSGLETHTLVGNALLSMYAKCGLVRKDAYAVFSSMNERDVVSWNAVIAGFSENGLMDDAFRLFCLMLKDHIQPNYATIVNILPICMSLDENSAFCVGKMIHCYALRHSAFLPDASVWNALVSFYMRVGLVEKAEILFRIMESKDLVSWNSIIAGYATNSEWSKSLESFHELLLLERVGLDSVTLVSILPACAELKNLRVGKEIHCYVLKHPCLRMDTSVGNALIKFYSKCNVIDAAYNTFLMISGKDLISWNSMLDAFVELRCDVHFLELFHWMLREGVKPDSITILAIVHFYSNNLKLNKVKEVHAYAMRYGFLTSDAEPAIGNGILDGYAKCGMIEYAFKFFHSISETRNLVTFNSMISGYVDFGLVNDACMIFNKMAVFDLTTWNLMVRAYAENDCHDQALGLFREVQTRGMKPDAVTIMSLLPVCTQAASLHLIKQCHGYAIRACFDDVHLEAALIDVYAKCGSIDCAYKLFELNPDKDLVMFTAMVGGFAMHGLGEEALKIFSHMLDLHINPDQVIITAILSACSHSGLVDEGLNIFYSIEKDHGMKPTMEQYSCIVDLLARGGQISQAYYIVTRMPMEPNSNIWSTLLGACRTYHEVELGRAVADRLFKIEGNDIGNYVILSNLYAADAQWDEVLEVRKLMRTRDLKKPAGCSWIEVDRRKNLFVVGDSCHPQRSGIYNVLGILGQQIKESFQLNQQFDLQLLECHK